MYDINYTVSQSLVVRSTPWYPVGGSVGIYRAVFAFSPEWDGLVKTAVFRSAAAEREQLLDENNSCIVPWEPLQMETGWLEVGVYGVDGTTKHPTYWDASVPIGPGPGKSNPAQEPSPDKWQQYVDAVAEDAEKAAEAKNAAAASATASAASAAAAAESAEDSEDSATAAAASASAAAQDASHAADSEHRSSEHAQSAEESARAAEGHAEAASESEQNAANYARDAEICAMDAASSAEEAKANAEAAKAVWRPSVSDSGVISWTKSDETTAPESQNIRGPKGEDADPALGISGASVGQTVQISAVDGSGKPTAWTAVDTPSGGGGSGAAPVQSVNGKTGAVTLNASDVGADATGTASSAVSAHNSSSSAHQDIRNAIPTIPASLKNPNALTFTGGATGSYDGSAAKTVNIPTTLKNPNALTFTGAATGTYDGSSALTINIPSSGGGSGSVPEDFVGATATAAGESGLVPAPAAGNNTKFLRGDGSWAMAVPPSTASDAGKFLRVGESGGQLWENMEIEKIGEVALEEEAVSIELDLPGKYNVILVKDDMPQASGKGQLRIWLNNVFCFTGSEYISDQSVIYSRKRLYAIIRAEPYALAFANGKSLNGSSQYDGGLGWNNYTAGPFETFKYGCLNGNVPLPAGTKIEVWGIKA